MTEKNMQTFFKSYLEKNPPVETEVYELKICKGTAFPFDNVQPHQVAALLEASTGTFYHKIQDSPVSWGADTKVRFTKKKPFDCIMLKRVPAYVVLWFYHKGQKKVFIKIAIQDFIQEKNESTRKSLTESRALNIGEPLYI